MELSSAWRFAARSVPVWRRLAAVAAVAGLAACGGGSGGGEPSPSGQPAIALSPGALPFSAKAGGSAPAAQTVTVTNSGAGTLATPTISIAYGAGSGWLTATVTGATAPFTITVQPTIAALPAGQYGATVSVGSAGASNSPQTFTVSLNVAASLLVRTATGASVDVTGSAWSDCYANEPSPGMSRRTIESFGVGTMTFTNVIFTASLDCTGSIDPSQSTTTTGQAAAQGDRQAGWENGPPPAVATTVTASAFLLTGWTPAVGIPDPLRTLFFVNDLASPQTMHMGKGVAAPDGYPTTLESWGKKRVAP